MKGSQNDRLIK